MDLVLKVDDLVGHPERSRVVTGTIPVRLRIADASVDGPLLLTGVVTGTVDGVQARFTVNAQADLVCVRCLTPWTETLEADGDRHFSRIPDEDGYAIVSGVVDLAGPARDELSLAVPLAPLCRPGCRGLCPICGTDLNEDPCDGHGDEPESPFTVLKDLFDPPRSGS
ncbi:MAG: YceD family protein [Actinobacteria bacterium]|nr:YceD family protein [Actinomycetota bacterium]MCI0544748.1 YceD family protein [Actinomycetota bacterium]